MQSNLFYKYILYWIFYQYYLFVSIYIFTSGGTEHNLILSPSVLILDNFFSFTFSFRSLLCSTSLFHRYFLSPVWTLMYPALSLFLLHISEIYKNFQQRQMNQKVPKSSDEKTMNCRLGGGQKMFPPFWNRNHFSTHYFLDLLCIFFNNTYKSFSISFIRYISKFALLIFHICLNFHVFQVLKISFNLSAAL